MRGSVKSWTSVTSGLALGLGLAWVYPALAQQGQGQDSPRGNRPQSSRDDGGRSGARENDRDRDRDRDRESSSGDKEPALDKVLESYQSYRERTGKDVDQTRKEVDKMVHELTDLIEMRYKMAVALATARSEQRQQAPVYSAGTNIQGGRNYGQGYVAPGQLASAYNPSGGSASGGSASGGQPQAQGQGQGGGGDQGQATREVLARELEQIQNQIRAEIEGARSQADQLASQVRAIREQQRAQMKAEEERKNSEKKNDGDKKRGESSDEKKDDSAGKKAGNP